MLSHLDLQGSVVVIALEFEKVAPESVMVMFMQHVGVPPDADLPFSLQLAEHSHQLSFLSLFQPTLPFLFYHLLSLRHIHVFLQFREVEHHLYFGHLSYLVVTEMSTVFMLQKDFQG